MLQNFPKSCLFFRTTVFHSGKIKNPQGVCHSGEAELLHAFTKHYTQKRVPNPLFIIILDRFVYMFAFYHLRKVGPNCDIMLLPMICSSCNEILTVHILIVFPNASLKRRIVTVI